MVIKSVCNSLINSDLDEFILTSSLGTVSAFCTKLLNLVFWQYMYHFNAVSTVLLCVNKDIINEKYRSKGHCRILDNNQVLLALHLHNNDCVF